MKNTIFQCVLVLCALLLGLNTQAANSDLRQWFSAVEHDHESDVLKQLLRGVHPNAVENERGDTALIIAVRENSMRVLKLLIGLPNTDLNARNR